MRAIGVVLLDDLGEIRRKARIGGVTTETSRGNATFHAPFGPVVCNLEFDTNLAMAVHWTVSGPALTASAAPDDPTNIRAANSLEGTIP